LRPGKSPGLSRERETALNTAQLKKREKEGGGLSNFTRSPLGLFGTLPRGKQGRGKKEEDVGIGGPQRRGIQLLFDPGVAKSQKKR